MSLSSYFSPQCETRELHSDTALRTRYYRNKFKEVVEGLYKLAEMNDMEVREVNEIHKEIHLLGKNHDCIVTVTQTTPIEAGIDFKINFFTAMGLNRPRKKVIKFYQDLKTILNYKGVSLHP